MDRCKFDKVIKIVNAIFVFFLGGGGNTSECVFEDNIAKQPIICQHFAGVKDGYRDVKMWLLRFFKSDMHL